LNLAPFLFKQDAINVDLPTSKKAIFTDPFLDLEKANSGHGDWSASIDRDGTLTPSFVMGFHDFDGSVPLITLDYTEVPAITQGFGTDITNVNPYAVINAAGVIQLTPSDDVWIDDQQIIVGNARNIVNAADIFGFWRSMRIRPGMWWTVSRFVRAQVRLEEEWIEGFSRASTITVNGSQYTPNSDNLALLFDGVSYALTPVPPNTARYRGRHRQDG